MTTLEILLLVAVYSIISTWVWYKMRWNRKEYHSSLTPENVFWSWVLTHSVCIFILLYHFISVFLVRAWRTDPVDHNEKKIRDFDTEQLVSWHKEIKKELDERLSN